MCEYFPGAEIHEWDPDCAATTQFRSAASSGAAGAPCEDGFQAIIDDMATACNAIDNTWTTTRCVATEAATESEASACSAVAAVDAQSCTNLPECVYLDPSTLRAVWEGWGCAEGTVEEPVCPVGCQQKVDHYCKFSVSLRMQPSLLCRYDAPQLSHIP